EIDAATEGELVLAVAARHQRIEAFAIRVARPARREIVGGDDDWRDAVAGTGWTQAAIGGRRRQRLDPGRARRVTADKTIDEIEGFRHNMIGRNGFEFRHIDAIEQSA